MIIIEAVQDWQDKVAELDRNACRAEFEKYMADVVKEEAGIELSKDEEDVFEKAERENC